MSNNLASLKAPNDRDMIDTIEHLGMKISDFSTEHLERLSFQLWVEIQNRSNLEQDGINCADSSNN